jgi:hypothetical protein
MILDATKLSHFQLCARRAAIELTHRAHRWRPKILFESFLREGIMLLSSPQPPDLNFMVKDLRARFLGQCANPGLDLPPGSNPFIIAKDWAMTLEMVLRVASRLTLLTLAPSETFPLSDSVSWRLMAPRDDSGTLHRWLATDRWDQDEFSRQAHSWYVFGDMAVARAPMQLHVVEVGQIRSSRRESCWTRGYKHRYAPNLPMRFKRPDGQAGKDCVTMYLADLQNDAEKWAEGIMKDGLAEKHIHHVSLECPSDDICDDTVRQILAEGKRFNALEASVRSGVSAWSNVPMTRTACDGLVPCIWQDACFTWPTPKDLESLGYVSLTSLTSYNGTHIRVVGTKQPS